MLKTICIGLGWLLFPFGVAQGALTLEQAYEQALSKVESIEIEKNRLGQARERVSQARATLLPSISLLATYQRQDVPEPLGGDVASRFRLRDQLNSRIALVQPLFRGGAEYAGLRSFQSQRSAQELQVEQARVDLFASVAQAFYEVLASHQDKKNLETLIELTEMRVRDLQSRSRIGRSREGEVLTAQAQVAVLKSQLRGAQAALEQARDGFALASGLSRTSELAVPTLDKFKRIRKLDSLGKYLDQIERRPDLKAMKDRLAAVEESVIVARAGHFPSLDLTGNYHLKRVGIQEGVMWDVGVLFSLPLFEGGAVVSRVEEAVALRKEQELSLAQSRRAAETQVRNAYESLVAGLEQIDALSEAARIAGLNYKSQNEDYRLGLVTNLEVLQALNTHQETNRTLDRVRYETLTAWAVLQASVGQAL